MTAPAVAEALDRLGSVLCQLGRQRVNLSWDEASGYHIDGRVAAGNYFHGFGDSPSAALACADRLAARPTAVGVHVNA